MATAPTRAAGATDTAADTAGETATDPTGGQPAPCVTTALPGVDVSTALSAANVIGRGAVGFAKDATYTAIGLGVMGLWTARERRRQIERALRR